MPRQREQILLLFSPRRRNISGWRFEYDAFALAILVSVPLPVFQPLSLSRARAPFSHPDWLFEIKWDGFRALAVIEHGRAQLYHAMDIRSLHSRSLENKSGLHCRPQHH